MKIKTPIFVEQAGEVAFNADSVRSPEYGRTLHDFKTGEVFCHPRGLTISLSYALEFATTFLESNPLYLNREYAKAHGFKDVLVSPLLTMNVALSLGVQNDSEKAMANLGYYNMMFLAPVYPGDTLRAFTKVLDVRDRGEGKPGIVTIRTTATNQNDELVLQYDRKIMVAPSSTAVPASTVIKSDMQERDGLPQVDLPDVDQYPADLTGQHTYFDSFKEGEVIVHRNGRTITDEHYAWTYRVMNTHPLHYDRLYSTGLSGKMSGEPIVYGGLAFAWLCGLASRDVSENALWDLGYTEGYHTQPLVSGDTVAALSRVLHKEPVDDKCGVVSFQLIGVKNIKAAAALEKYGADLFEKENAKKKAGKEKIVEKVFEIERRLLVKKSA
ncbi:MAG: MaoC family dehydratase N-terminal domain-containing protein [Deltaproteobacteria bacterium]|nr:MaoC family dehydratase N-terminal domain-containing protein [Deltaproteobacteria bacterium]